MNVMKMVQHRTAFAIANIPRGCVVTVGIEGVVVKGRVVENAGACMSVKVGEDLIVFIANDRIESLTIDGDDSVKAYEVNVSKRNAEFDQMMSKVKSHLEGHQP